MKQELMQSSAEQQHLLFHLTPNIYFVYLFHVNNAQSAGHFKVGTFLCFSEYVICLYSLANLFRNIFLSPRVLNTVSAQVNQQQFHCQMAKTPEIHFHNNKAPTTDANKIILYLSISNAARWKKVQ